MSLFDIVSDPRLAKLAASDRWAYLVIVSLDTEEFDGVSQVGRGAIAAMLGLSPMALGQTVRRLADAGLIDAKTLEPVRRRGGSE